MLFDDCNDNVYQGQDRIVLPCKGRLEEQEQEQEQEQVGHALGLPHSEDTSLLRQAKRLGHGGHQLLGRGLVVTVAIVGGVGQVDVLDLKSPNQLGLSEDLQSGY